MVPRATGTWQTVRLSLGEGDGEMTVKTRRDEERIAVTVQFSDPRLRSLATDQADRLLGALEARYEADVDLSFAEREGEPEQDHAPDGEHPARPPHKPAPADLTQPITGTNPAPSAGRNEWIG